MTHFYFAYGANTSHEGMSLRCPNAVRMGNAELHDYRFRFRRHADIEQHTGNSVVGVLWNVTQSDLKNLDHFEGYPLYYTRKIVQVRFNDENLNSWVYIMNDQDYTSDPHEIYLSICMEGYMENGLSLDQIQNALTNSESDLKTVL